MIIIYNKYNKYVHSWEKGVSQENSVRVKMKPEDFYHVGRLGRNEAPVE